MTRIRTLAASDAPQLETFLVQHRDSSMFMRVSAKRDGLECATYVGAFVGEELCGVIAHGPDGNMYVQAPRFTSELATACAKSSGRKIAGLLGPSSQIREAWSALELDSARITHNGNEWLYSLALPELAVPAALSTGEVVCRLPVSSERDMLCEWRLAYDVEAMGVEKSVEQRNRAATYLDAQIAEGNVWVAIACDSVVSLSAVNAALPDIVQVGGVYTPPQYRGRGYAKASVAATLLAARLQGVTRAVLFTDNPNAMRTYEALGFQRTGEYGLIIFK